MDPCRNPPREPGAEASTGQLVSAFSNGSLCANFQKQDSAFAATQASTSGFRHGVKFSRLRAKANTVSGNEIAFALSCKARMRMLLSLFQRTKPLCRVSRAIFSL